MSKKTIHNGSSNCVVYARVSDKEQVKGNSLHDQRHMCLEYAQTNGLNVVGVYSDEGKSWTSMKWRKGLMDAVARIGENWEKVGYLLVKDSDRLARNTRDYMSLREYLRTKGCKLIFVSNPGMDAESSPEQKYMDGMIAQTAEYYSWLNWVKTKGSMINKLRRWEWPQRAPIGYKNVRVGGDIWGRNVIGLDEDMSLLVREAFELFSTWNYSGARLLDVMTAKGLRWYRGKPLAKSAFIKMLQNPFYHGEMRYDGEAYKWAHVPLVDGSLFDKCKEVFLKHNHSADRRRKHGDHFHLTKYLRCGICWWKYTAEAHGSGREYYHCSLTKESHSNVWQNVTADELERQVLSHLGEVPLSVDHLKEVKRQAISLIDVANKKANRKRSSIVREINALESQRDRAEQLFFSSGITREVYERNASRINESLTECKKKLGALVVDITDNIDALDEYTSMSDLLPGIYEKADSFLKKAILGLFFDGMVVRDKKIVSVKYTKTLRALLGDTEGIIGDSWLPEQDSNLWPTG